MTLCILVHDFALHSYSCLPVSWQIIVLFVITKFTVFTFLATVLNSVYLLKKGNPGNKLSVHLFPLQRC